MPSIDDFLDALYRRDSDQIAEMFRELFNNTHGYAAIDEIIIPFLHGMGLAWETGAIDAGTEHIVSEIIRAELTVRLYDLAKLSDKHAIGFATIEGELHEFGALIGCYLSARMRYRSLYYGHGLKPKDVARLSIVQNVKIVVVSCPTAKKFKKEFFEKLARMLPQDIRIWIGAPRSLADVIPNSNRIVVFHEFGDFIEKLSHLESTNAKIEERKLALIPEFENATRH